jgi:hypothetical protein
VGDVRDECKGPWIVLGDNGSGWDMSEYVSREEANLAARRRQEKHGGVWTVARVNGYWKSRPMWLEGDEVLP